MQLVNFLFKNLTRKKPEGRQHYTPQHAVDTIWHFHPQVLYLLVVSTAIVSQQKVFGKGFSLLEKGCCNRALMVFSFCTLVSTLERALLNFSQLAYIISIFPVIASSHPVLEKTFLLYDRDRLHQRAILMLLERKERL